jgi:plasmid stabilization system protein ParE
VESTEKSQYQVEFTQSSKIYFYEILEYLYQYYSLERAESIATELEASAQNLNYNPNRGTSEKRLQHREKEYKFIIYKRSSRADIQIIYYIEEKTKTVYVTDFFPTEKDDTEIAERNG